MKITDDPRIARSDNICFGRWRLTESRLTLANLAGRYLAGETITEIAADYDIKCELVQLAIRWALSTRDWRSK